MPEIIIRGIGTEDLDEIAKIHKASFDDRALTQLGKGAVKKYYHWLLTGFSEIYPICAEEKSGGLAGFCFAGVYAGSFSGFLRQNKWYLAGNILLKPWLLFNPLIRDQAKLALRILKRMIKNRSFTRVGNDISPKEKIKMGSSFGILSIAVDPGFQRQGVGELLMSAVEKQAVVNGYAQLHLSVHPENIPAVKFYEKIGWKRSQLDCNWDGKMFKKLN